MSPASSPYRPIMRAALATYKATLSPLFQACGVHCRHAPTCSEYAAEAVSRHGAWAGGWMGLARVCRCRPGGSHGWDPVPTERLDQAATDKPKSGAWLTPWVYGDWTGPRRTMSGPEGSVTGDADT